MQESLAIIRPETVMRWHRAGFRSYLRLEVQAPSWPSRGVGRTGFTGIWKQPADPAQNQPVAGREWQPAHSTPAQQNDLRPEHQNLSFQRRP